MLYLGRATLSDTPYTPYTPFLHPLHLLTPLTHPYTPLPPLTPRMVQVARRLEHLGRAGLEDAKVALLPTLAMPTIPHRRATTVAVLLLYLP